MDHTPRWELGLALSIVTVLCWGMLPVALKGLLPGMDPSTITWYRFLVATLVLGAWLGRRGRLPGRSVLRGRVGGLFLVASVGLVGNYVVYLLGLGHVTPATAQVVVQLAPMVLLLGSLVLFREPFSRAQSLGLVVFGLGMSLYLEQGLPAVVQGMEDSRLGVGLVVAAAVLWGVYGLAQKRLMRDYSSAQVLWVVYAAGALSLLPAAHPASLLTLDSRGLWLLAFCCANTLVAYGCFAEALAWWEASRVSAVLAVTPLATAFFAELAARLLPGMVPQESWSARSGCGALLVVAGCAAAALGRPRAPTLATMPAPPTPSRVLA